MSQKMTYEPRITLGNVISTMIIAGSIGVAFFQVKSEIAVHSSEIVANTRRIADVKVDLVRVQDRQWIALERIENKLEALRIEITRLIIHKREDTER